MRKFWRNYSYAIILVLISFAGSLIYSNYLPSSADDYIKITVSKGETLWGISEQYAEHHSLSKTQFIELVEEYNGISADHIFAGDELIIPIKDIPVQMDQINLAAQ